MQSIYDYLIIGGGIAGTTAAETIRVQDPTGSIAIVEREARFLYSRIILSPFVKGDVSEESLFLRTLFDYEQKKIDTFMGEEVNLVDFEKKEVRLTSGGALNYKNVFISSGGRPARWEHEKGAPDRVFYLRGIEDAKRVKQFINAYKEVVFNNPKTGLSETRTGKVIVIGGGFIALELIDIFVSAGLSVVFLIRKKRLWENSFDDKEFGEIFSAWKMKGVEVIAEDEVENIISTKEGVEVHTKKARVFLVDGVAVGIGVTPNLEILQRQVDIGRGIKVNKYMETSRDGVWAAGDVTEYWDELSGTYRPSNTWAEAYLGGSVAGKNMAAAEAGKGEKYEFKPILSHSTEHLGIKITFLGHAEIGEGIKVVSRHHGVRGEFARFFLKEGKLIGAALINAQTLAGILMKWIREGRDLSAFADKLSDPAFDLSNLGPGVPGK